MVGAGAARKKERLSTSCNAQRWEHLAHTVASQQQVLPLGTCEKPLTGAFSVLRVTGQAANLTKRRGGPLQGCTRHKGVGGAGRAATGGRERNQLVARFGFEQVTACVRPL